MKFEGKNPPREFEVGTGKSFCLKDCGRMYLEADEQITMMTDRGAEFDVTRKDWGFYATPSLNGRLLKFSLTPLLVKNRDQKYFVLLVEKGKEAEFEAYRASEALEIVRRLDRPEEVFQGEKFEG